ncbi:MAG: hypothetical protein ASARMPREDX12_001577 [Alectoria sarmentosa]|nr:MAG: hypothetical protein ASARMPREDX12_001577 [Alectoria sarmentosa]
MPVITPSEGQSWDSNVYVQASTRVFVIIGVGYLVRYLYFQVSSTWGSRPASIAAGELAFLSTLHWSVDSQRLTASSYPIAAASGLALADIISDTLPAAPGAAGSGPDLEANLTLDVQRPQRGFNPQHHIQRSQASPRAYDQPAETPESSVAAIAIPEQDVGVRNVSDGVEEESEVSIGLVD